MAEQVSPGDLNMDSQTSGLESGGNNNHTKTIDDLGAVQTGGTNVECSVGHQNHPYQKIERLETNMIS